MSFRPSDYEGYSALMIKSAGLGISITLEIGQGRKDKRGLLHRQGPRPRNSLHSAKIDQCTATMIDS